MTALIWQRMIRAAKLDSELYEEVEHDRDATAQAVAVVVLSSLAAGLGTIGYGSIASVLLGVIGALVGWALWIAIIYGIGVKLFPEPNTRSDPAELLRTTGFAAAPGVLRIAAIVPLLGALVSLAAGIWMLVTMVIAVRQALDYKSTGRAIGVCLLGWLAFMLVFYLLASVGIPTPGPA